MNRIVLLASLLASSCMSNQAASSRGLRVEIVPDKPEEAESTLHLRFINDSNEPVKLLTPLDGSDLGILMPYYLIRIADGQGRPLRESLRDDGVTGLWQSTVWPDDYEVVLQPGKTFDLEWNLPYDVPAAGFYRAEFEYVYRPNPEKQGKFPPVRDAWRGSVRAPPVRLPLHPYVYKQIKSKQDLSTLEGKDYVSIDADFSNLTDRGLEAFAGFSRLRTLSLRGTSITDEGLKIIGSLSNLRRLDLSDTRVGDAGLVHLMTLSRLRYLNLNSTQITSAGFRSAGLPPLEELHLYETKIDDDALKSIASMVSLKNLSLGKTRISDLGFSYMGSLTELRVLSIGQTDLTDKSLETLAQLIRLRHLSVFKNRFSGRGLSKLNSQLPHLRIFD